MRRIRIGKDISIKWPILTNGVDMSLEGRDLRLRISTGNQAPADLDFSTAGNVVSAVFRGRDQRSLGKYALTLWENFGKDKQSVVDRCDAFELVRTTCAEGGADAASDLKTETLDLEAGNMEVSTYTVTVVPSGGYPGQALVKDSEKDGDVTWSDVATPEDLKDMDVIRYGTPQDLTPEEQVMAWANAGIDITILTMEEIEAGVSKEKCLKMVNDCQAVLVRGFSYGDRLFIRGASNGTVCYFYSHHNLAYLSCLQVFANGPLRIEQSQIDPLGVLKYSVAQQLTSQQQNIARMNISAVGYLPIEASMKDASTGWDVSITSSIDDIREAYNLFRAAPGHYRWGISLWDGPAAAGASLLEESSLHAVAVNGGLELIFRSAHSERYYAIVLSVDSSGSLTGVHVEPRTEEEDASMRLFIDMWNAACGKYGRYNEETGYFELNGLTDITYEQALLIYQHYSPSSRARLEEGYRSNIRTNIPVNTQWMGYLIRMCQNNDVMEVVNIPIWASDVMQAFYGCTNLRKVNAGSWISVQNVASAFRRCYKLETLTFSGLRVSLSLSDSPLLSLESIRSMIDAHRTYASTAISIELHPDVYSRLTSGEDEEWTQALNDASETNVSFTTTE